MLGEEFDEGGVGFAIVRFGAKIDGENTRSVGGSGSGLYDFFTGTARFDGDLISHTIIIA